MTTVQEIENMEAKNLQGAPPLSEENLPTEVASLSENLPQEEISSENMEAVPESLKEDPSEKVLDEVSLSANLPQEESNNLPEEGASGDNKHDGTCESPNKATVPSKHPDGVLENTKDTEFALDGELLDFEDFALNSESVDKNNVAEKEAGSDKKLENNEKEDGACSEGECNDQEDLEEGELREPSSMSDTQGQPTRQVCRFFHRGSCFYGISCRFLHLTNNQKGNYSMFETTTQRSSSGFSSHNAGSQRQPPRVPEFINSAPVPFCAEESAWEKGLREARNLLKQANQKRNDPNFNEKKLNISLCVNEKNIPSDNISREKMELKKMPQKRNRENYYKGYDAYGDSLSHMYNERREKDSRDNPPRHLRKESDGDRRFSKGRKDIDRPFFVDEPFFDPWRRSKSPNRERSHSSFSSYSSPPYSRSSSGSRSRSRASSRSSCRSSRSPSVQQKRKVSPVPETAVSPKVSSNRFGPVKKKPGPRTSSSRSRSVSRNSSRSRSISMDSVSSASESRNSTVSHSSSDSEHEIKDLREKPSVTNPDSASLDNKFRGIGSILNSKRDLLEEKFEEAPVEMDLRYLIPKVPEKKEPVRLALTHKNPIKLTLLNKLPQPKAGFSKDSKEFGVKKPDEPLKLNLLQGVKRPLSPSESVEPAKPTPVLLPKKSASSRRDELLKQLKAVEDAIARKRAKF